MGGDDALDLMVVDQLRNAEELLAHRAGRAAHIVGDQGQVLRAPGHQLLDDSAGLAASQEAAAHNRGAVGDHGRRFLGSQYRFLCHFCSSYFFMTATTGPSAYAVDPVVPYGFTSCRA